MKKIITLAIAILVAATSFAQSSHRYTQVYSFNWQSSLPVGESAAFIPNMCLNGADFNFTYFVTDHIGVGVDFAWNLNSKQTPPQVYPINDNAAIYAAVYKTVQNIPMKTQFKYLFNPYSFVKVYASAGLGATSYVVNTQIQEYQFSDSSWGFLMSPEVGILVPFGKDVHWGANAAVGYNWATNKAQNLYFNLGIFFSVF